MANPYGAQLLGPSAPGIRTQSTFSLQLWTTDDSGAVIQLGTCKEFSISQDRRNTKVGGVGIGDRILEIVPGRSSYSAKLSKFALWEKSVAQALGFQMPNQPTGEGIRMLAHMQKPFNITQLHLDPNDQSGNTYRQTIYRLCVISRWNKSQRWDEDVTLVDDMDIDITMIDDGSPSLTSLSSVF